jgi:hypothetical protein
MLNLVGSEFGVWEKFTLKDMTNKLKMIVRNLANILSEPRQYMT